MTRPPRRSTLFPYTTLFRSGFVAAVGKRVSEAGFGGDVAELGRLRGCRGEGQCHGGGDSHLPGVFSPSFFRKSVNSPSGGRCNFSSTCCCFLALSTLPELR